MKNLENKSVIANLDCDVVAKNTPECVAGDDAVTSVNAATVGIACEVATTLSSVSSEELDSEQCTEKKTKGKDKLVARSRKIAIMAIFLAIGIVFNVLTFPSITLFGRMTLLYFYCFLTGIVVGPVRGMIVTMLADVIVFFFGLVPGALVPQLTLSNGLMALIMGFTYNKLGKKHFKLYTCLIGIFTLVFLSAGLNAWGEAMMLFDILPYGFAKSLGKTLNISSPFLMLSLSKLITQSFWIAINCYILILITPIVTSLMEKSNFK